MANGRAKLTRLDADLIREEYAIGETTQRALATKYGVSQMAIWQVLAEVTFVTTRNPGSGSERAA